MQSMMSCLGGCSAIAHRGRLLRRKETRLLSISLQVLDFVSGYLSLMSLAVSVPRGAIAPLQLAVAIILEELEDEIQWDTVDYVAREA